MNLIETGQFIKNRRKEIGLTQQQLAEKLEVSEKTISKWECGNGFPDTSLVLPLCEVLKITANELLSAKVLGKDDYKQQAEQNLIELNQLHERNTKFLLTLEIVLGVISTSTLFTLVLMAGLFNLPTYARVLMIVGGFIVFLVGIHFCLLIEKDAGYYECKHCHHKHVPSYKQVCLAMHMGRTRYMRCPNCNKKSWQKKVISK